MKLMTLTAAALGAFTLAACTPAGEETATDAAAVDTETSTMAPATEGAMAPSDETTGATTPVNPAGSTTPPGQTPPTLPPEPGSSTSPATSSPPPM